MKIISEKTEKLIVYDMYEVSLEKFIESYVHVGATLNPKWVDGFLLYFTSHEQTEYIQKLEVEKHTMIWNYLEYIKMPKFESVLKNKEANAEIRIQDVSANQFFKDIAKFLKELPRSN